MITGFASLILPGWPGGFRAAHPATMLGLICRHWNLFCRSLKSFGRKNKTENVQSRVKRMLKVSSLLVQLVWIFQASAVFVERVTIPAPIVVEPSESCRSNSRKCAALIVD